MVFFVGLITGTLVGFGLGYSILTLTYKKKCVGTLREDHSDPTEAPYLFLELEPNGLEKIHKNKSVVLNVRIENYLPRN